MPDEIRRPAASGLREPRLLLALVTVAVMTASPAAQTPTPPAPPSSGTPSSETPPPAPAASEPAVMATLDAGPLLGFHAVVSDGPRVEAVRIVELEGERVVEIHRGEKRARLLARLDRDHLLLTLRAPDSLFVVHAPSGRTREIVARDAEFLGQRGDDLVIQRQGRLQRVSWREPAAPPRPLGDRALLGVTLHDNIAFGVVRPADGAPRIDVVSLVTGRSRQLWTAPSDHDRFRLALSPGGQRLAVAAMDSSYRAQLVVLDAATGRPIRAFADLPVFLSPFASGMPTLEVAFADDDHVVCSESRGDAGGVRGEFVHVTRSLLTGEITAEAPYGPLGVHHLPPRPAAAEPHYVVVQDADHATLRAIDSDEPLARIARQRQQYHDLAVAPDGRFAAARLGPGRRRLTVFAPDREPRPVSVAWAHDLCWLPAAR